MSSGQEESITQLPAQRNAEKNAQRNAERNAEQIENSDDQRPHPPTVLPIDHTLIGQYANANLNHKLTDSSILIQIESNQTRSSTFSQYTAYLIDGKDRNGEFKVHRRFNEFHQMRGSLLKRFPGCFIPSIPDKNFLKNSPELINKRQRYLNDFVRKMAGLPHLYYSEQFQALLHSKEKDVSNLFSAWPSVTVTEIINRYKDCFGNLLSGKEVGVVTRDKVYQFAATLKTIQIKGQHYRKSLKQLALERDKLDHHYLTLFQFSLSNYQRNNIQSDPEDESHLIMLNPQFAKMPEHGAIMGDALRKNPYWLLYDLMQHETRDAGAFLEAISARQQYYQLYSSKEIKIAEVSRNILELERANLSHSKGNDEQKYKLQMMNQKLKMERDECLKLLDIMTALLAYVEVEKYKREREEEYRNALQRIGGYQINMVQNVGEVWRDWCRAAEVMMARHLL